jgi:Thioredoxin-like
MRQQRVTASSSRQQKDNNSAVAAILSCGSAYGKLLVLVALSTLFVVVQMSSLLTATTNSSSNLHHSSAKDDESRESSETFSYQSSPKQHHPPPYVHDDGIHEDRKLRDDKGPLSTLFPSLAEALEESDLVGIYFAAAWCPMSTPVTNLLDTVYRATLQEKERTLSIVYVSSDKDRTSFQRYLKPGWKYVPFDNVTERDSIKRYFKTCAKKEMKDLGLDHRDNEIPNLVIVGSRTQTVLTRTAIVDLKKEQQRGTTMTTLQHWMDLQRPQQQETAHIESKLQVAR